MALNKARIERTLDAELIPQFGYALGDLRYVGDKFANNILVE